MDERSRSGERRGRQASASDVLFWHPGQVEEEPAVETSEGETAAGEIMRPCVFCGHPVKEESLDEYECPVCGVPPEA